MRPASNSGCGHGTRLLGDMPARPHVPKELGAEPWDWRGGLSTTHGCTGRRGEEGVPRLQCSVFLFDDSSSRTHRQRGQPLGVASKSLPTSVTQVVLTAASVAGWALGARLAGFVRGFSDPVPPVDAPKTPSGAVPPEDLGPPLPFPGLSRGGRRECVPGKGGEAAARSLENSRRLRVRGCNISFLPSTLVPSHWGVCHHPPGPTSACVLLYTTLNTARHSPAQPQHLRTGKLPRSLMVSHFSKE